MAQLTLKDIYDVVNDRMDRMEDQILPRINDLEKRQNSVEKVFSNMAGKVAIGVLVVGTFVGVLTDFVINFFKNLKS